MNMINVEISFRDTEAVTSINLCFGGELGSVQQNVPKARFSASGARRSATATQCGAAHRKELIVQIILTHIGRQTETEEKKRVERERRKRERRKKKVIIWAKFVHFRCYYLGQVGVIIWAKLFLAYKNSGFKRFLHTQLSFSVFLCPIIWQLSKNSLFQKMGAKIGFFKFLCLKLIFGKFSFFRFAKTL